MGKLNKLNQKINTPKQKKEHMIKFDSRVFLMFYDMKLGYVVHMWV